MQHAEPLLQIYRHPYAADLPFPRYESASAAGIDLRSAESDFDLLPGSRTLVQTGLRIAIPDGWAGLVRSRSGLFARYGVLAMHGTIDADYRGDLMVGLYLTAGAGPVRIARGDRIAQLLLAPTPQAKLAEVMLSDFEALTTARGTGGFGSTGTH